MSAVLILDNGGCKIKYGTESNVTPQGSMTNCTARVNKQMQVLVGEQVDASFNGSNLCFSRPFEKGYLVNWACELDVWGRLFGASCLNIVTTEMALVLTEPPFNPDSIQNDTNEIVFEEYGFREYMRRPSAWFSAYEFAMEPPVDACNPSCCTVVDSGFSFSHSLPFISSRCRKQTVSVINFWSIGIFIDMYVHFPRRYSDQACQCWGEVVDKLFKRGRIVPSMEHDGRIQTY